MYNDQHYPEENYCSEEYADYYEEEDLK